ncbi:MAG: NRDE family protein, partial [Burkholderiales bacterium]|nr:NRDE family protein [Burkholderiales bacterium]
MCLAAIAVAQSERFPWVVASNRDEFFARAAAPLAWWQPAPGRPPVLGGR